MPCMGQKLSFNSIDSIDMVSHYFEGNMRRSLMLWLLVFVLLFLALNGLGGGIVMLIDPTGNMLGVADVLPLLPVPNFILPGLFLVVVMGIVPVLLSYALIARPKWPLVDALFQWGQHYWAWTATLGLVAILAIWLLVEGLLIGMFPITYATAVVGLLLLLIAMSPGVRKFYAHE